MHNYRMLRTIGLNQNLPRAFAPASSSSKLHEELETLFASQQIRAMQQSIGSQDSCKSYSRQVYPFSKHLSSNEYICLTRSKFLK